MWNIFSSRKLSLLFVFMMAVGTASLSFALIFLFVSDKNRSRMEERVQLVTSVVPIPARTASLQLQVLQQKIPA